MGKYYDGTKLLSLSDINGNKPEIYICTTNRTGGKTVYFSRLVVNKFLKNKEKFAILYRFNYELDDCADKFFKDIKNLFFPEYNMKSRKRAKGIYHELFIDDEQCGYAISLNSADQLKKYSHLFSDVKRIMFDEFQSETGNYCNNEVKKLLSIHTSIARGNGEQVRYVPVYMISNPVSLINPYYIELGISDKLREDTRFLRGDGFVMEQGYVDSAAQAQKESGFNRAFSGNSYVQYSSEAIYLNDIKTFIEKPKGRNRYYCTLKYDGINYAVREFVDEGIVYCDNSVDMDYPCRICVSSHDHDVNYIMLRDNSLILGTLRYYFEKGCVRFKNLQCKEAFIKALSF